MRALFLPILLTALTTGLGLAQTAAPLPFRLWAQKADLHVGTAIDLEPLRQDARYRQIAGQEFSMLTPANCMKMEPLRPAMDRFHWEDADAFVTFAEANAQQVHGHALVWHRQNPQWLEKGNWSREELMQILREHITTVVTRYKGRIRLWDVVNEAVEEDGSRRHNLWQRIIGPEYIELAFRWAHEAAPSARLIYNDFSAEDMGPKSNGVYEMLRDLKSRGVPVHGVGFQLHVTVGQLPSETDFGNNLTRLAALGLELHVTEADIRIPTPAKPEVLALQAANFRTLFEVASSFPELRSFSTWGFTDRHSWISQEFPGHGAGLLWDEDYQAKPAHSALLEAFRNRKTATGK